MDADARRIRAIARFARWWYRTGRDAYRAPLIRRWASWRLARARWAVERAAAFDIFADHTDPDANIAALDLDPGDDCGHAAAAIYWRVFDDYAALGRRVRAAFDGEWSDVPVEGLRPPGPASPEVRHPGG